MARFFSQNEAYENMKHMKHIFAKTQTSDNYLDKPEKFTL